MRLHSGDRDIQDRHRSVHGVSGARRGRHDCLGSTEPGPEADTRWRHSDDGVHTRDVLFGHFVLRLNVADNVGATCGSMTGGAAIGEVCKDANSSVPAVSFALGATLQNVTFTIVALVLMNIL